MSFTNFGGGLVNTIVAGAGDRISTGLTNALTSNVAFSVNGLLAGAVQDTSGYALNDGANYLTSQISSLVPTSVDGGLTNAVVTQVATVGINALTDFAGQTISSIFGVGNPVTGLVGGSVNKGTISVPMDYVQQLPDADYEGFAYNLSPDVVFTIVPANAGPQLLSPPQSSPKTDWTVGFDPSFAGKTPGIDALKGEAFLAGPGSGTFGAGLAGKNYGVNYTMPTTTIPNSPSFIANYW